MTNILIKFSFNFNIANNFKPAIKIYNYFYFKNIIHNDRGIMEVSNNFHIILIIFIIVLSLVSNLAVINQLMG